MQDLKGKFQMRRRKRNKLRKFLKDYGFSIVVAIIALIITFLVFISFARL